MIWPHISSVCEVHLTYLLTSTILCKSWYQHSVRPDRCIGMFESVAINRATTNHSDTRYRRSEPAARHWTCFLEYEVTTTCHSAALARCVWAVVWRECNCSPLVLSNILSNLPSKQLVAHWTVDLAWRPYLRKTRTLIPNCMNIGKGVWS